MPQPMSQNTPRRSVASLAIASLVLLAPLSVADPDLQYLKGLSLEELADMQVSILSKRPERVADSAAALYVLTADDIRRSGYTTIPELLRLVPGMNVARIDTSEWAISSRGFNSRFANKLLVMIDGRSVYNSLFSGVYWEALDTLIQDIERIEVIRGPGASTWGSNAVNGVINIITKHAADTQGALASVHDGNQQSGLAARYGAQAGASSHIRAYAKYDNREPQEKLDSGNDVKDFYGKRVGLRGDWEPSEDDTLMVQAELYDANADDPWLNGGNLTMQWHHIRQSGAEDSLQAYYNHFAMKSDSQLQALREQEDTIDIEYQHQFAELGRHDLIAGLGYQWQQSDISSNALLAAKPPKRSYARVSAFIQDEINLLNDQWYLTLGTKLEHNDFTGVEIQPSVRSRWRPRADATVWAAISRAVRTPNRSEHDLVAEQLAMPGGLSTGGVPVYYRITADRVMISEELIAYEAGYRWRPVSTLGMDLSMFYNDYSELRTLELGTPEPSLSPFPRWIIPITAENKMRGYSYGLELMADWHPADDLRVQAWYSFLDMNLKLDPDSKPLETEEIKTQSPEHQAGMRAGIDLPHNLELDLFLRYVSALPDFTVDEYVELDARIGWNASRHLSLSLVGRNLLHSSHQEFGEEAILNAPPHDFLREIFLRAELRY
ncbi:TonB-dependent receptor plug domain-containing protein [Thiolapillus sp.]